MTRGIMIMHWIPAINIPKLYQHGEFWIIFWAASCNYAINDSSNGDTAITSKFWAHYLLLTSPRGEANALWA